MAVSFLDTKWKACVTEHINALLSMLPWVTSNMKYGFSWSRTHYFNYYVQFGSMNIYTIRNLEALHKFFRIGLWQRHFFPPNMFYKCRPKMKYCGRLKFIGSRKKTLQIWSHEIKLLALSPKVAWIVFFFFYCVSIFNWLMVNAFVSHNFCSLRCDENELVHSIYVAY